jgi:hypothetical protein
VSRPDKCQAQQASDKAVSLGAEALGSETIPKVGMDPTDGPVGVILPVLALGFVRLRPATRRVARVSWCPALGGGAAVKVSWPSASQIGDVPVISVIFAEASRSQACLQIEQQMLLALAFQRRQVGMIKQTAQCVALEPHMS